MKRLLITLLMLALPAVALADGPASVTVSGTTSGVKYLIQPIAEVNNPRQFNLTATCVDDGFTVTAWRLLQDGATWKWLGTEIGISSPDSTHAPANMVLPIEGRFHVLRFTTDTINADIDLHVYSE